MTNPILTSKRVIIGVQAPACLGVQVEAEVHRVVDRGVVAQPAGRREQVRRDAGQEHAAALVETFGHQRAGCKHQFTPSGFCVHQVDQLPQLIANISRLSKQSVFPVPRKPIGFGNSRTFAVK